MSQNALHARATMLIRDSRFPFRQRPSVEQVASVNYSSMSFFTFYTHNHSSAMTILVPTQITIPGSCALMGKFWQLLLGRGTARHLHVDRS